jgi:hypothetical protein
MTTPPPVDEYSTDGSHRRDGTAWQPAQALEVPKPARRYPIRTITIGALLIGGLLGAGVGTGTGLAVPQPHGPSAPPAFGAGFPNGDQRFLPGVTVSLIATKWLERDNKWTCEENNKPQFGAVHQLDCTAPGNQKYDVNVDIDYDDETHVRAVSASCSYRPGAEACRSLFANVANIVLYSQADLRKQGEDWASKNVDTDNDTVIGGVRLDAKLEPHYLHITPEP